MSRGRSCPWDATVWEELTDLLPTLEFEDAGLVVRHIATYYPSSALVAKCVDHCDALPKDVQKLLLQCVKASPFAFVWKAYIELLRRRGQVCASAFSAAVESAGFDIHSGDLWCGFAGCAVCDGDLVKAQRVYEFALTLPLSQLSKLKKEYEAFCRTTGRAITSPNSDEADASHSLAILEPMVPDYYFCPFDPQHASVREAEQLLRWHTFILSHIKLNLSHAIVKHSFCAMVSQFHTYELCWAEYSLYVCCTETVAAATSVASEGIDACKGSGNLVLRCLLAHYSQQSLAESPSSLRESLAKLSLAGNILDSHKTFLRAFGKTVTAQKTASWQVYAHWTTVEESLFAENPELANQILRRGLQNCSVSLEDYLTLSSHAIDHYHRANNEVEERNQLSHSTELCVQNALLLPAGTVEMWRRKGQRVEAAHAGVTSNLLSSLRCRDLINIYRIKCFHPVDNYEFETMSQQNDIAESVSKVLEWNACSASNKLNQRIEGFRLIRDVVSVCFPNGWKKLDLPPNSVRALPADDPDAIVAPKELRGPSKKLVLNASAARRQNLPRKMSISANATTMLPQLGKLLSASKASAQSDVQLNVSWVMRILAEAHDLYQNSKLKKQPE